MAVMMNTLGRRAQAQNETQVAEGAETTVEKVLCLRVSVCVAVVVCVAALQLFHYVSFTINKISHQTLYR